MLHQYDPRNDDQPPPHGAPQPPPSPPPDRNQLTVEAWRALRLPPRDYLLDDMMCTTSRWIVVGDTGVGKTLFGLELGFAVASASPFLTWQGTRPACVMYLDGEMPAETFKERIEAAAQIYGNVDLIGYNRDVLGPDDMPPLNTEPGQAWLRREIEAVKPDLLIGDSLMCLLVGPLSDEETWAPMKSLVRQLSARRIAQVWLHHTGHDTSRGFGTKTMQWEMDTVAMLSRDGDDGPLTFEFTKARLRTPQTAGLFRPQSIVRGADGWTSQPGIGGKAKAMTDRERKKRWFGQAYSDLASVTEPEMGTGRRFVRLDDIRERMVQCGFLARENGKISGAERNAFYRAKEDLIATTHFAADDVHFWEVHPL